MHPVSEESIYGPWGRPDLGFLNTLSLRDERLARSHYMLVVSVAASLFTRYHPSASLAGLAHGFRVGYEFEENVLWARRFAPAGTNLDGSTQDLFFKASVVVSDALISNGVIPVKLPEGARLERKLMAMARILSRRGVSIKWRQMF
jgi:hypothetical protein